MHGNVREWTADRHEDRYHARSPVDDPTGPADGAVKVPRGGSCHTWPPHAGWGCRNWSVPGTRFKLEGIRLMMEADE